MITIFRFPKPHFEMMWGNFELEKLERSPFVGISVPHLWSEKRSTRLEIPAPEIPAANLHFAGPTPGVAAFFWENPTPAAPHFSLPIE